MENLCQLDGLSCMACCVKWDLKPKKIIEAQLKENTKRFLKTKKKFDNQSHSNPQYSLKVFMKETGKHVGRKSEMCKALIEVDGKLLCPAHPDSRFNISGRELRKWCQKKFECETVQRFKNWDKDKQQSFIRFVRSKNLDWYSYSSAVDNGSLLKEFEEKVLF